MSSCSFSPALLFFVPEWTIYPFSRTPEIVDLGLDYIVFAKYTYIPYGISFTCMMAMRAIGLNKIQLKVGIIAVLTNTILNYILIYGKLGSPAMGVKGAALATMIARLLEMAIYLALLIRQRHFYKLDLKGLIFLDWSLMKSMLAKAVPLTVNELFFSDRHLPGFQILHAGRRAAGSGHLGGGYGHEPGVYRFRGTVFRCCNLYRRKAGRRQAGRG